MSELQIIIATICTIGLFIIIPVIIYMNYKDGKEIEREERLQERKKNNARNNKQL